MKHVCKVANDTGKVMVNLRILCTFVLNLGHVRNRQTNC